MKYARQFVKYLKTLPEPERRGMTKIQEAREKAITAFAEYIKQDQHGTQKSNHMENEGYVKRIQGIADRAGVQVMMQCAYCGHTGADVHENTQRTYAGTFKTIGRCDNIRACSERMVQAVQEKALAEAGLIRCGQATEQFKPERR